MRNIDFYFDFGSPYAYFAALHIDALAARNDCAVTWQPVMLASFFQVTGGMPAPLMPVKRDYVLHDFARTARRCNVPFKLPPVFPQMLVGAPRAMLWLRREQGDPLATEFARRCFAAAFGEGMDLSDEQVLGAIARGLGIDEQAMLAGMQEPAIKAALREQGEAAMQRGAFGVPFMIADGEPFWGFDHFAELEAWLQAARAAA
jgi:2-hydroxychromene-2-carboxylate isomerase